MSTRATDASQQMLQIATSVATHGYAVIPVGYGVCSIPGCCGGQLSRHPWTYTIGLSETQQPELMLFALEPISAHHAITLAADWVLAGRHLPVNRPIFLDDMLLKVVDVPPSWLAVDRSRMALWFNHYGPGRRQLAAPRVRQLLWADERCRFPDDPSCDPEVVAAQPVLSVDPLRYPRTHSRRTASRHKAKKRR